MIEEQGYQLVNGLLSGELHSTLVTEFDRLADIAGSACVRQVFSRSDIIRSLATSPELLRHLPQGFAPVRCILFDKTEKNNWPVAWHQDLTIAVKQKAEAEGYINWSEKEGVTHVQPPVDLLEKMVTARIHLDDTPAENGALKVIPKSHLFGRLDSTSIANRTKAEPTICECATGDLLLMKPLILHASARSTIPAHRRVIHIEYANRSTLDPALQWDDDLLATNRP